jgi:mannosyltransferase
VSSVRDRRRALLVPLAGALGAAAVAVRFVTRSPLWLDEALSVHVAQLPFGDIADALRHDGHPPLYYWLLHGWMELVGDGDVAVRALSGLFGVAALPLVWLAGRRVAGPPAGWAAVLLLAWSPFAVRYSTETRMYSLVTLLVLCGYLLLRRAVDERRAGGPTLAGIAAASAALLLTQYWSIFLAAATVLTLAWWGRTNGGDRRPVAVRLIGAVVAGGLPFLLWLPAFLDQAGHTGTPWATAPRPTVVLNETLTSFGGGEIAEAGLLAALLVLLVAVGVVARSSPSGVVLGGGLHASVAGEAAVSALTLAIGAVAGLLTASTFASRYASVILPLVVLVAARGLVVLPGKVRWAAAGLVVLFGAAGIVDNIRSHRTQAEDHAAAVAAEVSVGDAVVVCPDQLGPATRRALDQAGLPDVPVLAYPTLGDGRRVDWYDYEERNDGADPAAVAAEIDERVPEDAHVWVVWSGSYRTFEGDCEALLNALSTTRGPFRGVVPDGATDFFERAALVVFG